MRAPSSTTSTRRLVASLVVACSALSGCFALFSLDGYGPPVDTTTGDAAISDLDADVSPDAVSRDAALLGKTIFVTGTTFNGDLGARDGGDDKCQAVATDAGLRGVYRVWLSDVGSDGADHLVRDAGPLRLRNGDVVAADLEDLVKSGPRTAIARDERGRAVGGGGGCADGGLLAWTGTLPDGGSAGQIECSEWSYGGSGNFGLAGLVGQPGPEWTSACYRPCNTAAALYCIQQ